MQVYFPGAEAGKVRLQRWLHSRSSRPFEPEFAALDLLLDAPDALYLDIGAHYGFATDAILKSRRRAAVMAFEPNPLLADQLRDRYRDHYRVAVQPFGLGEEAGEFTLYLPVYRGYPFYGLASLDRERAAGWLRDGRLYGYDERQLQLRELRCELRSLDELNLEPCFIKIDVQGHEAAVLRGAQETLREHEPVLLIEGSRPGSPALAFLEALGYEPYEVRDGVFVPGPGRPPNTLLLAGAATRQLAQPAP